MTPHVPLDRVLTAVRSVHRQKETAVSAPEPSVAEQVVGYCVCSDGPDYPAPDCGIPEHRAKGLAQRGRPSPAALYPLADFTPAQAERRDRIEGAPEPAEIVEYREKLERVAIVIHEHSDTGPGIEGRWCRCGWTGQGHAGHVAAVAIAAIAAPQTGEHTTDEEGQGR